MAQRHHSARAQGMAGTILGIAVDLNAYPYLLHLLPGPTPSGRPRSVLTVPVGKERCAQVQHISSQGNSVRVGLRSHHGQAFRLGLPLDLLDGGVSRGPDHGLGLSLCVWADPGV